MKKILITAGGTTEPIDDVRFVSNVSTGKLGMKIASEFLKAGFEATLLLKAGSVLNISDLNNLPVDFSSNFLEVLRFTSADDLYRKMKKLIESKTYLAVIHSAAVADYSPVKTTGKISSGGELKVQFRATPKIIKEIKNWDPQIFLVGFKLESSIPDEKLVNAALKSLKSNRADLVIANDLTLIRTGAHRGLFVSGKGLETIAEGKENIAKELVSYLKQKFKGGESNES